MKSKQLTLMDAVMTMSRRKKTSRAVGTLESIGKLVDWEALVELVEPLDKTREGRGGRPPIAFEVKLRMLFLQNTFGLSDEELEDQLIDRLSFQQFVGLGYDEEIPDFTTFWKFKEKLAKAGLMHRIFEEIVKQIEERGLILKRGTIIDATLIRSANRPMTKEKREKAKESSQLDADATGVVQGGKNHFGYKGHIGMDEGSKIIRKCELTPANVPDRERMHEMMSGDERSVWADKAYPVKAAKSAARASDIYYGVLDRAARSTPLTKRQKKKNAKKSRVRRVVEHAFGFMRKKLKVTVMGAKNIVRNTLRFEMWCTVYNVLRAAFLLRRKCA
jgi:IS5 family transposase